MWLIYSLIDSAVILLIYTPSLRSILTLEIHPPPVSNISPESGQVSCEKYPASGAIYLGSTNSCTSAANNDYVIAVIADGDITLALILYFAPSLAIALENPTIAVLAAA